MSEQMHPLLGERQSASCVNYLRDVLSGSKRKKNNNSTFNAQKPKEREHLHLQVT